METSFTVVKFYTVVKRILKQTFRTVVLRRSECMRDELTGVYIGGIHKVPVQRTWWSVIQKNH